MLTIIVVIDRRLDTSLKYPGLEESGTPTLHFGH